MLGLDKGKKVIRSHIANKLQAYMRALGSVRLWDYEMEHDLKDCIPRVADIYIRNYLVTVDPR